MTGTFLTTNERYVIPIPREADYIPILPDVEEGEAPHAPLTQALQTKLREGAFEGRRKAVEKQKSDERMIWPLMWKLMSAASQSKVREDPDFEDAFLHLDCIRLWNFIRRSHLTHIFGNSDPMREVNIGEQEARYAALKQGEREYLSTFKTRFDSQIQAGEGAGVAEVTESKRAIEFSKLDPRRYGNMSSKMRNDALRNVPDAYPTTLAAAYRVASGWVNEHGTTTPATSEIAQESVFVTADAYPGIDTKIQNRKKQYMKKGNSASSVTCFVCGLVGHYARDCSKRLGQDKALLTRGQQHVDDDDENGVYVCQREHEKAMFTRYDILLDTEASLNGFCNRDLLTNVTPATHHVVMTGVDSNAKGVKVIEQGQFENVGIVYYSAQATANILSFASQIDEGATIDYNKSTDVFTLQPAHDNRIYTFARKQTHGSEGRLYSCDTRSMVATVETVNIATIEENLSHFSKRDIASALKARQLLARMSFPSVEDVKLTVRHGTNFTVSPADFDNADTIWGPDTATLKGKSTKQPSPPATLTVLPAKLNPPQILSVDILFLDKLPVLIGIAHPLDLTLGTPLTGLDPDIPSRSAAAVKIALDTLLNTLTSKAYTASVIMTDGEGAIGKLIPYLNELGIEVDVSAAGGHVARVERRIRVIKERVRAHMAYHLPYGLSTLCLTMLVLYCVSRLNFMPSGTRADNYSPREVFLGQHSWRTMYYRSACG
jgi:Zinc knuckle